MEETWEIWELWEIWGHYHAWGWGGGGLFSGGFFPRTLRVYFTTSQQALHNNYIINKQGNVSLLTTSRLNSISCLHFLSIMIEN